MDNNIYTSFSIRNLLQPPTIPFENATFNTINTNNINFLPEELMERYNQRIELLNRDIAIRNFINSQHDIIVREQQQRNMSNFMNIINNLFPEREEIDWHNRPLTVNLEEYINNTLYDNTSHRQVNNNSKIKLYVDVVGSFLCPILAETSTQCVITVCGHHFNKNALDQWLKENDKCPTCRQTILKEDDTHNTHQHTQQNIDSSDTESNSTDDEQVYFTYYP
jgi:transcriptional regulator